MAVGGCTDVNSVYMAMTGVNAPFWPWWIKWRWAMVYHRPDWPGSGADQLCRNRVQLQAGNFGRYRARA